MSNPCVIGRIFGGLGNQLFCYAAARRLSLVNGVPLKLDITSGFQNDKYKREYLLDRFNIQADIANSSECFMDRFGPTRHRIKFHFNRLLPFNWRTYLFEETPRLDTRLLNYRVRKDVYLTGYWQSEEYFKDINDILRNDLRITMSLSSATLSAAAKIQRSNSVSLHVRSYSEVPADDGAIILKPDYYDRAAKVIATRVSAPHFYCFSDDPGWADSNLCLPYPITIIRCNNGKGSNGAVEDLWLMSQCHHHIIANSTFSWWGAWLNEEPNRVVVGPIAGVLSENKHWLPEKWLKT